MPAPYLECIILGKFQARLYATPSTPIQTIRGRNSKGKVVDMPRRMYDKPHETSTDRKVEDRGDLLTTPATYSKRVLALWRTKLFSKACFYYITDVKREEVNIRTFEFP